MTEAFAAMGLRMPAPLANWIKEHFNVSQNVIECLNICHMYNVETMGTFAIFPPAQAIDTLSISGLKHPDISMALLVTYTIGIIYAEKDQQNLWESYTSITKEDITEKFQQAKFSGIITAYERKTLERLREFYGINTPRLRHSDAASRSSTITTRKQPPIPAPVVVETPSVPADDASEITVEAPAVSSITSQKKGGSHKSRASVQDAYSHSSKRSLKPTLDPI